MTLTVLEVVRPLVSELWPREGGDSRASAGSLILAETVEKLGSEMRLDFLEALSRGRGALCGPVEAS
jgi:hypothetical protein